MKLKKNNKRIILLFISFFILIIILFLSFLFFEKKEKQSLIPESPITATTQNYKHIPLNIELCEKKEGERKEACIEEIKRRKIMIETENMKECLELENMNNRNNCLTYLITNFDRDSCFRIADHGVQVKCIIRTSTFDQDLKRCEYFKDEIYEYNECRDRVKAYIFGESTNKEDIEKCKEIKTLEYPKLCYNRAFKYQFDNDCNKVPKEFQDYCVAEKNIIMATTKEHCSFIRLDEYKRLCLLKIELGGDLRKLEKVDTDNDMLADGNELFTTTDPENPDTDGDGLLDGKELFVYHTNPRNPDTDYDGLTDYEEIFVYNTHSGKSDTDGDGILDGAEVKAGTNPHTGDSDKDGLLDIDEKKFGTNINNSDTDGDGMNDFKETRSGFDPLKPGQDLSDTDGDGLLDADEIFYGTDRFNSDTDNDGISDKEEINNLTNPLGKGDMDFDGDGISDREEIKIGSNPGLFD